jgi:hypothetical protein
MSMKDCDLISSRSQITLFVQGNILISITAEYIYSNLLYVSLCNFTNYVHLVPKTVVVFHVTELYAVFTQFY